MTSLIFGKDARSDVTKRLCDFIRRLYPIKTAVCFETDTRIAADTFRKWDAGIASPSFVHFLTCISFYGPEFLAAVFERAPAWLSAAARDAQMRDLERKIAEQQARLKELERA